MEVDHLDALEPFSEGGRWWAVEFPGHGGLVSDIDKLIAELREARRVVEAVKAIQELAKPSNSLAIPDTLNAIQELANDALAEYEEATK